MTTRRTRRRGFQEGAQSVLVWLAEFVAGFLVFVLAGVGFGLLIAPNRPIHYLEGSVMLAVAIPIMFATAGRWGGFIPGFFFLGAFYKSLGSIVVPVHGATRLESALIAGYSIAMIALLWRFVPPRRTEATILDRAALTICACSFAVFLSFAHSPYAMAIPMIGSIPLLFAWITCLRRRSRHHTSHHRAAPDGEPRAGA